MAIFQYVDLVKFIGKDPTSRRINVKPISRYFQVIRGRKTRRRTRRRKKEAKKLAFRAALAHNFTRMFSVELQMVLFLTVSVLQINELII